MNISDKSIYLDHERMDALLLQGTRRAADSVPASASDGSDQSSRFGENPYTFFFPPLPLLPFILGQSDRMGYLF